MFRFWQRGGAVAAYSETEHRRVRVANYLRGEACQLGRLLRPLDRDSAANACGPDLQSLTDHLGRILPRGVRRDIRRRLVGS